MFKRFMVNNFSACAVLIRTFFTQMASNNNPAVALLTRRLTEAEKNIRLLSVEVKKIRRELSLLNSTNDSTDAFSANYNEYSTTVKRSHTENEDEDFKIKKIKQEFILENDYVIVYTDGACTNNGRKGAKAGLGVWWGTNHPLNVSKPTQNRHTNNAGEIQACTEACKIASENGIKKLIIRTDSNFVIKCMTEWIHRWKKNNWKTAAGKDVINKEDLVDLEKQSNLLNEVKYEHVSGHSGIRGNEEADRLAVRGAEMSTF